MPESRRAGNQAQDFTGLGQADDERVIAPGALVGDVHAGLARARGLDERAVHVDRGPVEEGPWLLGPDLQADLVDGIVQPGDGGVVEAAAEVTGRGRIGNALGTQGIEEGLVVATTFDVFEASALAQGVVSPGAPGLRTWSDS